MRKALVIGGLVVVALVAALWLALKKDLAEQPPESTGASSPTGEPAVRAPGGERPTVTQGTVGQPPAIPEPPPGANPRDYVVGDIRVRDHRAGNHAPLDIPPNVHPAEGRKIPSTLTHEISQKVKAVMMQCVADVPREARGEKPRLEGQIAIAIKGKQLSVTRATMHLRNMSGESVEPARQCIEQKSIGLVNPAPDQDDLDDYTINLSFAIP